MMSYSQRQKEKRQAARATKTTPAPTPVAQSTPTPSIAAPPSTPTHAANGLAISQMAARVASILNNASLAPLTARERFESLPKGAQQILESARLAGMGNFGAPPIPRTNEVIRIIGSYSPALLSPAERWSLLDDSARQILTNYQAAGGGKYVPTP